MHSKKYHPNSPSLNFLDRLKHRTLPLAPLQLLINFLPLLSTQKSLPIASRIKIAMRLKLIIPKQTRFARTERTFKTFPRLLLIGKETRMTDTIVTVIAG